MKPKIAIIAQTGLYPGTLSANELYKNCLEKNINITSINKDRWRVDKQYVLCDNHAIKPDHTWSDKGGYVDDFAALFDPQSFAIDKDLILQLDPLYQWLLYLGNKLFNSIKRKKDEKTAFIIGNLSYPSYAMAEFTENIWLANNNISKNSKVINPLNRFMSGLPAQILAAALGINPVMAFCLDAACASSFYSIKLAKDALEAGEVDLAIAGGINRADDLFIHIGFSALQALSRSGKSSPLAQQADGLIPAEGAGLIALRRLEDAIHLGEEILAIVPAIGLSNDGNQGGFLQPSSQGQIKAMLNAYQAANLQPELIDWVECHATGTPTGDAIEIQSMQAIFKDCHELRIGAIKGNIGHMITASGMGAVAKILLALKNEKFPGTVHIANEKPPIVKDTPFLVPTETTPWLNGDKPRFAALNGFGFGGNNAHMIIQEWQPESNTVYPNSSRSVVKEKIAVVGIGVVAQQCFGLNDLLKIYTNKIKQLKPVMEHGDLQESRVDNIPFSFDQIRFPPNDLKQSLGQQLSILHAVLQSIAMLQYPQLETAILIGMQCSTEICRYGLRWRLPSLFEMLDEEIYQWIDQSKAMIGGALTSAQVLGAMPNIVANRINCQIDARAPSFSISSEQLSGLTAVKLAINSLSKNECDLAVVGAVDFSCEIANQLAIQQILQKNNTGDLAVAYALMRENQVKQLNLPIYAFIDNLIDTSQVENNDRIENCCGYSHAAVGASRLMSAILNCAYKIKPAEVGGKVKPWYKQSKNSLRQNAIKQTSFFDQAIQLKVTESNQNFILNKPILWCYSADDLATLKANLQGLPNQHMSGQCRLAIVAADQVQAQHILNQTIEWFNNDCQNQNPQGSFFSCEKFLGDVAFVYTGASTSYNYMGFNLVQAFPDILTSFNLKQAVMQRILNYLYDNADFKLQMNEDMQASSFLAQFHDRFSKEILGLQPNAVIGYCSGETNALVATGAWRDMEDLFLDVEKSAMYTEKLSGNFSVLRQAWAKKTNDFQWSSWRLLIDVAKVKEVIDDYPLAHLAIINTYQDCIVSGHPSECTALIKRLNCDNAKELPFRMVIHCQDLLPEVAMWRQVHTRKTYPLTDVTLYSTASGEPYQANQENAANALINQALYTVNFPQVIENAWQAGSRIFIEHGPRDLCSGWIKSILKSKPHIVLSYDQAIKEPFTQAVKLSAHLWTLQLASLDRLLERLS
ncbi:MAG: beta-ketoacyl synthase N-terminal-like domain-containing protein [Pseudomonadota bacterium]